MRNLAVVGMLLLGLGAQPVFANQQVVEPTHQLSVSKVSPRQLIEKLQNAFHRLDYELSYIRVRQGSIEPIRLFHGVVGKHEVVHRIFLNGPVREAVRRDQTVAYYEFGKSPFAIHAKRLPGMLATLADIPLDVLSANYDLLVSGRGRVAGRPAQIMRIIPKHESLYGLYVWQDISTGLPLRVDIVDRQGNLVEQLMVIGLSEFKKPTLWMNKLAALKLPVVIEPPKSQQMSADWQVRWKPGGMKVVAENQHKLPITDQSVDYLKLSDGLFDVSIYASSSKASQSLQGELVRQGAISLHSIIRHGVVITVVGEVPPQTATLIAESVKLVPVENKPEETIHD
ncbi:MAG: Sigma-E factor regulatory protein RseB [Candidatus Celerinatantimonas neptuna]|nr:MAG: Sigma-E factor regulatory protein RseB [Candidatus Celerinatantimonas neptuna]